MGSTNSQQLKWLSTDWLSVDCTPAVLPEIGDGDGVSEMADRTTRLGQNRIVTTTDYRHRRHHASRAWSVCACCCCIFFNRFLSDRLSGVCGVGLNAQQAANQKPETADGSHFLPTAFLKLVNLKEITRKIKLKKKNHLHFHWFSPTWLTFSPRETRYDYQLSFLKTQRQSQFRMRYGTHLFSWVRFKVHKFVNSSICKPH